MMIGVKMIEGALGFFRRKLPPNNDNKNKKISSDWGTSSYSNNSGCHGNVKCTMLSVYSHILLCSHIPWCNYCRQNYSTVWHVARNGTVDSGMALLAQGWHCWLRDY